MEAPVGGPQYGCMGAVLEVGQGDRADDEEFDGADGQCGAGLLLREVLEDEVSHAEADGLAEADEVSNGGISGGALEFDDGHPQHGN